MKPELIIPGEHMTQAEKDYLLHIIGIVSQATPPYEPPYELVGSRTRKDWISRKQMREFGHDIGLYDSQIEQDWKLLNDLAKRLCLCRGQIPELIRYLPSDAPSRIKQYFGDREFANNLGSDIDLKVGQIPKNASRYFKDKPYPEGTGQRVDIFQGKRFGII